MRKKNLKKGDELIFITGAGTNHNTRYEGIFIEYRRVVGYPKHPFWRNNIANVKLTRSPEASLNDNTNKIGDIIPINVDHLYFINGEQIKRIPKIKSEKEKLDKMREKVTDMVAEGGYSMIRDLVNLVPKKKLEDKYFKK